ncbi:Error-prone DNA polymerase [compost metagenome]
MGFYSPDQILQDARRHRIESRPVDVRYSDWDCTLEPSEREQMAIRLGLRMVRGFREDDARGIERARSERGFSDVLDLSERAHLDARARELLADAGALQGLAGHRHLARWEVAAVQAQLPLFAGLAHQPEKDVSLPVPSVAQDVYSDYATVGTTLGPHPLALIRRQLNARGCRSSQGLLAAEHGDALSVAGLVTGRQRPQTASGVTFVTLEDEHGMINVVVWKALAERQRRALIQSRLLQVYGRFETVDGVRHVIARRLQDLTHLLTGLDVRSRDFH